MNKSKMQEVTMEVTVGFFMLMILLLVALFSIFISRNNIFKKTHPVTVTFENVSGLRSGDSVFYRGVSFGKVGDMEMLESAKGVIVTLEMDMPISLHDDYAFDIQTASALGGKQVVINEGSLDKPTLATLEGLTGNKPADLLEEATGLLTYIRDELTSGGMLSNLAIASDNLKDLSEKINNGEGSIARLINEDTLYKDLEMITGNLKTVSDNLASGEGLMGKMLAKDNKMYEELETLVTSLNTSAERVDKITADVAKISSRIEEGKGTLGKLLSEDDELYQNLLATSESAKELVDSINFSADSTIGKLLNDDDLYTEFMNLVTEAQATIDDLRETSPITTFGSIFLGAF